MAWGAFILLVSLYFQLVQGLTPLQAGVAILPFDFAFLFVGPLSGRLSDKYGTRRFTTAGLLTVSVSLLLLSTIGPSTSYAVTAAYLAIGGGGMGLFVSPNISSVMGSVPAQRRGVASGLRATFFSVGFTLSFNIVILVLASYLPYGLVSSIVSSSGGVPPSLADRTLFGEGLNRAYLVLAVVNTLAVVPSLLRGKRVSSVSPQAGPDSNTREGGAVSVD